MLATIQPTKEGWKCPVCSRGVHPDVKMCDHGGITATSPYKGATWGPATTAGAAGLSYGGTPLDVIGVRYTSGAA